MPHIQMAVVSIHAKDDTIAKIVTSIVRKRLPMVRMPCAPSATSSSIVIAEPLATGGASPALTIPGLIHNVVRECHCIPPISWTVPSLTASPQNGSRTQCTTYFRVNHPGSYTGNFTCSTIAKRRISGHIEFQQTRVLSIGSQQEVPFDINSCAL